MKYVVSRDSKNPETVVVADLTKLPVTPGSTRYIETGFLAGKTFKIVSAEILGEDGQSQGGWILADTESVEQNKTTAGYDYADNNFAIALTTGIEDGSTDTDVDLYDLKVGSEFTFPAYDKDAKLTFTLHNANALTQSTPAGTYQLTMKSDLDESLTFVIKINRQPAQIHATVPLYICMYGYGGDGKVVTPDNYGIVNQSDFPLQITSVTGTHTSGGWGLKDSAADLKAGELFLRLADQTITSETKNTSGNSLWRIAASGTMGEDDGRLTIPISAAIAGDNVNKGGESEVCSVTYTTGIPKY
jgi:hypothetical protein